MKNSFHFGILPHTPHILNYNLDSFSNLNQKGWRIRDIVLTIITSPVQQVGQGVHHTYLQTLSFYLGDMYRASLNTEADEISKRIKGQVNTEICLSLGN
jgi:hypothetical protein